MLLVLCVDLDNDIGRKTGLETPVIGRDAVEEAAVDLATVDPEDSDVNVLFEGLHLYDRLEDEEAVSIAAVTGERDGGVTANRQVGAELDEVLASLTSREGIRAVVVTDGAQDESVVPVIQSRVTVDGVRRVVVRQAQNLESIYYTIKQVLDDPETRGTILVPMGILLLIYPLAIIGDFLGLPGAVFGITSALVGLYFLFRGLGLEDVFDDLADRVRRSLYSGRVTLVTYVVAAVLLVIGVAEGIELLDTVRTDRGGTLDPLAILAALTFGTVRWLAAAGITTSLGQITDEFLREQFEWRYLNAPFYVIAIAVVLHAVSGFFIGRVGPTTLAVMLTAGTVMGVLSTLTFAVVESYRSGRAQAS
jgi:putative membrane protein